MSIFPSRIDPFMVLDIVKVLQKVCKTLVSNVRRLRLCFKKLSFQGLLIAYSVELFLVRI